VVIGPINNIKNISSCVFIADIINGKIFSDDYGIKKVLPPNFGYIDNRDVSEGTIKALVAPEAAGRRYLLVNRGETSFLRMATVLLEQFPEYKQHVPDYTDDIQYIENSHDNTGLIQLLGREPKSLSDLIRYYFIDPSKATTTLILILPFHYSKVLSPSGGS